MLFKNDTAQEIWIDHWCERCYEPNELARRTGEDDLRYCPILRSALSTGRKPVQWDRNNRAQTMAAAYKCNAYQSKPNVIGKLDKQFEDVPMFDVEPAQPTLIPVDGWPDRPTKNEVDHQ